MSISVQQLCLEAENQYGMHLAAGGNGLHRTVRWVYTVEDREVPDFLHGNELIFTTGIGHVGQDPLLDFVKRLQKHGAAGLVVNIGPYVNEIPQVVLEYCNLTDFPLFTLPWAVYIIDITYDFCRRIIEQEKQEKSLQDTISGMLENPEYIVDAAEKLKYRGFGMNSTYRLAYLRFYQGGVNITASLTERLNSTLNALFKNNNPSMQLMMIYHNGLLLIRQNTDEKDLPDLIQNIVSTCEKMETVCAAGLSAEGDFNRIPALFQEAHTAQKAAKQTKKSALSYNSLGIYKILLGIHDQNVLTDFADGVLENILSHDRKYRTHYADFLRAYIHFDGSVNAVAEYFGCHRNTVNAKIKAIKETFGLELNEEEKVELSLAFRIYNLYAKNA